MFVQSIKGEFVLSVGSRGTSLGQFNGLSGLSLTPDETCLLVCDRNNNRVVVADACDGRSLRSLQGPEGTLSFPMQAVVVPLTGQVLVVDFIRNVLVVFAGVDDDTVVRTLGDGLGSLPRQLKNPCGVAVLDGDAADAAAPDGPVAVVADTFNDRLAMWRVRDGTVVRHVGSRGSGPRAVSVVPARATGTGDAWLVVAGDNRCVQVLTRTGAVVRMLQGNAAIRLGPILFGLTVRMGTGEVLVTDEFNYRVVSWRLSDGGGLRVVCGGVRGSGPGQLAGPMGVTASDNGALWVVDADNSRLSLFR
jgi:DNA-binding beta-propeller fold protein YncE